MRAFLSATTGVALSLAAMAFAPVPGRPFQSDLDAFMATVLAHRDENWKKLQQYVLDEREQMDVHGPSNQPIWGERRDYTWFIREGYFVRSPTRVNGVDVPDAERRKYEDEHVRRLRRREGREAGSDNAVGAQGEAAAAGLSGVLTQVRQPGFIDSAYFLKFKFEQGTYALVGRESLEGRDVLRIEYYPARLFSHEQDNQDRRNNTGASNREKDAAAATERMLNKVAIVTLWVEPSARQIVKYTFANVNLDFLPVSWFVRVDDLSATMTMSQPFAGVWLPRDVDMRARMQFAAGDLSMNYRLEYHDYKEATTSGRIQSIGN